ncbi:hypothetical protein [Sulfitobacter sp. W074]|uniref:hypothetical protein n=1 Tax=Sulfitobacter sp. W074 TaxID=2867026 RepID=UPI0021A3BA3C|nr:hypothetical protein [Sulfitobacter sp. W074]UWR39423.1 hypothetical protein K3762_18885 [Sulfitobacter sp. W074]
MAIEDGAGLAKTAYDALLGNSQLDATGFDFWLDLYEGSTIDTFAPANAFTQRMPFLGAFSRDGGLIAAIPTTHGIYLQAPFQTQILQSVFGGQASKDGNKDCVFSASLNGSLKILYM